MGYFTLRGTTMVCIFTFIAGICANAQQSRLLRFEVESPDTVTQGTDFSITYRLVATDYSGYEAPDFKEFEVKGADHKTSVTVVAKRKYHVLSVIYQLLPIHVGTYELPKQSMLVGKKRVYSKSKKIFVAPNPLYGKELELATKFLVSQGVSPDSCSLVLGKRTKDVSLFSDTQYKHFVLVANDCYSPYIDNPVLAWSTESAMHNMDANIELIDFYVKQLQQLREKKKKAVAFRPVSYSAKHKQVPQLLGKIAYGQENPYNWILPQISERNSESALVGCVPVAMVQIMASYKYPDKGKGKYTYKSTNGIAYNMSIKDIKFDWDRLHATYDKKEEDSVVIKPIAELMAAASISLAAKYEKSRTAANMGDVKSALINFFGYSPSCAFVRDIPADQWMGLMYRELDNKRPLILSGGSHAFVCDGYKDDYFHFNMGWSGYCNGYYRIPLFTATDKLPYDSMIIGIEPGSSVSKVKSIEVPEAGTLGTLLTDEEKQTLTGLSISGKLNNDDIALLRRMLGAVDDNDYFSWRGVLRTLDLQKVKLVKSKGEYIKIDAQKWGYHITRTTSIITVGAMGKRYQRSDYNNSYDFDNMDIKKWQAFCRDKLYKGPGYLITAENGRYYIHYFVEKNAIGHAMFLNCENLKTILLPEGINVIRENAFNGCKSLIYVPLPKKVKAIKDYAFAHTRLLEGIHYTNSIDMNVIEVLYDSNPFGKGFIR